jgi:hypothetical protein
MKKLKQDEAKIKSSATYDTEMSFSFCHFAARLTQKLLKRAIQRKWLTLRESIRRAALDLLSPAKPSSI